jgi:hypothetical protein
VPDNLSNPSQVDGLLEQFARRRMMRRELRMYGKIAVLLLFGLPALFLGPLLISGLYTGIATRFGYILDPSLVWSLANAVVIPLLFWTEYKTEGTYLSRAVADYKGSSLSWDSDSPGLMIFVPRIRLEVMGIVEISLWGPRQILDAVGKMRALAALRSASRDQARSILLELIAADQAKAVNSIIDGVGSSMDGLSAIAYLLFFDWVSASSDAKSIWATSETKAELTP